MKLQEYHAKSLLQAAGLPVPPWSVATTAAAAGTVAAGYLAEGAGQVVIKAQVLAGGRGKAGGVKLAATAEDAEGAAAAILGRSIKGITVRRLLVGPAADIAHEYYLGAVIDRAARRILVMGSAEGGVEIEEVAATRPAAIVRVHAHPHLGLLDHQARALAFALGLGDHLAEFVAIAKGLVACLVANDADLVEVNPLGLVRAGDGPDPALTLACLDAKITLDDSALAR
ncbi:MAG: ATP-grasp domain-containing protein, partial [Candidatus Limnocylindrales bacterium]